MSFRPGFGNLRTLTGRLAAFFMLISLVIAVVVVQLFVEGLRWSEDQMSQRRMLIDRDEAVARFKTGSSGVVSLDELTIAYNDMQLVPELYREYLEGVGDYLGEPLELPGEPEHMIYKGQYDDNGQVRDIVLLSQVDRIEFTSEELVSVGAVVVGLVILLMLVFVALLHRLSRYLIQPLIDLAEQLQQQSGQSQMPFSIPAQAADEFQLLTQHLNLYRIELNETLKREKAFARYASHELRTPLTIAKGAGKLLGRTELTDYQRRQAGRISDATEQMIMMVDALLSIVRHERNTDADPLRLIKRAELEKIIASNSLQAQDKALQLELQIAGEPQTRATTAVLEMVLGNLLRNAIAATPRGTIVVFVTEEALEVIDQGTGLTATPDKDGHGLGLMIVDDFSRRYGWTFTLENAEKHGCRARILFSRQPSYDTA
ncbi:sensor histidine kinase [Parendozoicomonas haliclonae]|uniref:histidine kinase n=1 Tax=Parendozoicomonas haliclonae TaxID=1960125 RepID=A0A1X7AMZ6_9GAMM|nr:HAMP domain-containing sensor histidine kinase [Parendozoicomonas haliclonae]SMA49645.1 Sensor protein CreC [Parendozoicomonas haliclonae]